MIIECPSCQARYQYDEQRFERQPSKKIRCARCKGVFEIANPAFAPKKPVVVSTESTRTRRDVGKPQTEPQVPEPQGSEESVPEVEPPAPLTGPLQLPRGWRLSLAILDGPEAGKVIRIETPRFTIGRTGADLPLDDTEASRIHAAVEIRDNSITLHDLGSTNGTMRNGEKIEGAVELNDKAEFQVGSTTLMLIVTEEQ